MAERAAMRVPPTREVVAAAILATFSGLGVFVPFAIGALFSGMVSHQPSGLEALLRVPATVLSVPLVSVIAGVAAVAMYRGSTWGRRLALGVAILLLLSPVAAVLDGMLMQGGDSGDDTDSAVGVVVDLVWRHLFAMAPRALALTVTAVLVGGTVAFGVLTRPRQAPVQDGASGSTARRPRVAMVLLLLLSVESLVPYLSSLARLALPGAEQSGQSGVEALNIGGGTLTMIATFAASGLALFAARAILTRAPVGPYVAPMAAAIAGPWCAIPLGVIGGGLTSPSYTDSGLEVSAGLPSLIAGWVLIALAVVAISAPFVIAVSVFRRRSWFRLPGERLPTGAPTNSSRFARAIGAAAVVLAAPFVIGAASIIINPPPPPVGENVAILDGRAYEFVAPASLEGQSPASAGTLTGWSASLTITDPTAYAVEGVPVEQAIIIGLTGPEQSWPYGLFVASDGCCELPQEACGYVPIEDPDVFVSECGPPEEVVDDGRLFLVIHDPGFVVGSADLSPTGRQVTTNGRLDPRVDPDVLAIGGVPDTEAIAVVVGRRIVLYGAASRPALGELCRYSPAAVAGAYAAQWEAEKGLLPADETVPGGCELPSEIWADGRAYRRDDAELAVLAVPVEALTPIGTAEGSDTGSDTDDGDPQRFPFPSTLDATAYRIADVDPETAIAVMAGGRVVVFLHELDKYGLPLPAELCRYVSAGASENDLAPEEIGCPA